jgi:hypothetical protein
MTQERKKDIPNVERQGWKAEKLVEEGANKDSDETVRQILRGDETKGNPDQRDVAGSPKSIDTPHGREEEKRD